MNRATRYFIKISCRFVFPVFPAVSTRINCETAASKVCLYLGQSHSFLRLVLATHHGTLPEQGELSLSNFL